MPTEKFEHLSILAVDDNAVNREVLREALMSLSAEGDFVTNGVEAVEAATRKRYDVIFMDGSMPEMDGFTATKLIREAEAREGSTPAYVVALTAQVRGADADAWAAAGADRHMTKPFTSTRLTEALKSAGTGTRLASPGADSVVQPTPALPVLEAAVVHTAPTNTPLIDGEAVATMEAVGARSGRDVVGKVWKLFLGQAPDAAFKLETLAQGGDPGAVAKQAHFLKSMSLSAGAAQLADLCEDLEHAGKSGDIQATREKLAAIRPLLDDTCAEMNRRLTARLAAAAS